MSVTLDVSNYDVSTFDAQCLFASGVDRIIAGCWDLSATRSLITASRWASIVADDLYTFLYFGLSHEQREVTHAVTLRESDTRLRRAWLDIEATAPHAAAVTPSYRIDAALRARQTLEAAGFIVGVYTTEHYWRTYMANTTAFADCPLWLANWGTNNPNAPRPVITAVSFGGFTRVSVHQYSSTIWRCGRARDHNYWMLDGDPMERPDTYDAALNEALLQREAIRGVAGALTVAAADPQLWRVVETYETLKRHGFLVQRDDGQWVPRQW